jgi:hypothetical protein
LLTLKPESAPPVETNTSAPAFAAAIVPMPDSPASSPSTRLLTVRISAAASVVPL